MIKRKVFSRFAALTLICCSLLASCKAHNVDERAWLEDVLRRMPEYELGKKDFADLLPGNWSPEIAK